MRRRRGREMRRRDRMKRHVERRREKEENYAARKTREGGTT